MSTPTEALRAVLPATDDAYFTLDEASQAALVEKLTFLDVEGIALGGPKEVDTRRRTALPILWAIRAGVRRDWSVADRTNAVLTVTDLDRGTTSAYEAFPSPKKREDSSFRSRTGPEPTGGSMRVDASWIDVRSVAHLPWEPARYAVRAMLLDWITNGVVIDVTGATARADVVEALPRYARARAVAVGAEDRASAKDPSAPVRFRRSDRTPELVGPGAALAVPPTGSTALPRLDVHGTASLDVPAAALVVPPAVDESRDPDAPVPSAVVPLSVMLAQLDERHPRLLHVEVPVYSEGPLAPGAPVEVSFSLDLLAATSGQLAGDYCLYLFAGEHVSGPHALSIR
jgi:hypothetical protein